MSDVKRYDMDENGAAYELENGDWVHYEDAAALHSLLVKACINFAHMGAWLEDIEKTYGIRIRMNGVAFEEDTTK